MENIGASATPCSGFEASSSSSWRRDADGAAVCLWLRVCICFSECVCVCVRKLSIGNFKTINTGISCIHFCGVVSLVFMCMLEKRNKRGLDNLCMIYSSSMGCTIW